MQQMRLGRTGLLVTRTSFGVLPLQRTPKDEAIRILRRAHETGINFFDTARGYSDSEEKIGLALSHVRHEIVIATKSGADTRDKLLKDLETSLNKLRTDHVDIIQLHKPKAIPDPTDPQSPYAGLIEARAKGMARFIGVTNHSSKLAKEALASGLFDTLQFPLSMLSSVEDLDLIDRARKADVGVIAMKPLAGGLITHIRAAFAFFRQYDNVAPIWGIQRMEELEEFLRLEAVPPELDDALRSAIEKDRAELSGDFCRACGYCLPCPAEIPIPMAARMSLLLRRMPWEDFLGNGWREKMERIENCIDCGHCRDHCPYGLDTPELLKRNLAAYRDFRQPNF
ncbi:MAG: aldo/keto reductase [Planctomycetes bacterium]|nr:aldo/keto reductase [Planctomycetota bacterium]